MDIKRLKKEKETLEKIVKMIEKVNDLYQSLDTETQFILSDEFNWGNKPEQAINNVEIVLTDCVNIMDDMIEKES